MCIVRAQWHPRSVRGAVPVFVLYPAKLVECAMERLFQTCLLSGSLAEGAPSLAPASIARPRRTSSRSR